VQYTANKFSLAVNWVNVLEACTAIFTRVYKVRKKVLIKLTNYNNRTQISKSS